MHIMALLQMRRQLFVILNLSLVSGFVIVGLSIISPVLPDYAGSFNISTELVGWAVAAFAAARMVMDIPAGVLADRFGRKRNMIFGLILVVLSSIAGGTAESYSWLIFARVAEGLGSAFYVTSATTWVAQVSAGEYRGRYMSLYSGLLFAGAAFGPTIGGYAAEHFNSLRAPFFAYALFAFIGLMATLPLKEPVDTAQAARAKVSVRDVPSVLLNGPFMLVNLSVLALFFLRSGVRSTLVPLYASHNLGLTPGRIGIVLSVAAIVTAALTFPSGWLSDKVGRKRPIMACLLLSAISVLLVPLQKSFGSLMGTMAFYGLATGLQGSIAAWPADVAPEGKLGTAMGVYREMGDLGLVLGPPTVTYIAGSISQSTVTFTPFLAPAVLCFVVGLLMMKAKDPAARRHAKEFVIQ
jgi:DHA1 family multidrug resistance protein-like MFS transporter